MTASLRRIWALVFRHLCLFRRSWPRVLELAYWPILQMLIWGLTAQFLFARTGGGLALLGGALLGGVLLWEVSMRSQIGMALSFLEEVWSRNLAHLLISPLRTSEFIAGLVLISLLRTAIGVACAASLAYVLYAFNLLALGPVLVLFFANLLIMGWWVSLGVIALILRHGAGAEAFAWSILIGLTPLCAVYYPVTIIPMPWRLFSLALPASHVFEGMRAALAGRTAWHELAAASLLNVAWTAVAAATLTAALRGARQRGALLTIGE